VEVSYAESGISTDLDRVTCPRNAVCNGYVRDAVGYLDEVQGLRDAYKADEVVLIGDGYTAGGACGVAWLMSGNEPAFAPNAYAVVDLTCATGYYSFGHELGHNMGLNHARPDPTGLGAFEYSYGYKNPADAFRTVMAYCCGYETGACRPGCPRVLRFSNPNVLYGGSPTGVSEALPNSAHNALSLNNTRVTVANWRVSLNPTVTLTSPNGGQSWPAGAARQHRLDVGGPPGRGEGPHQLRGRQRARLDGERAGRGGRRGGTGLPRLVLLDRAVDPRELLEGGPLRARGAARARGAVFLPRERHERCALHDHALTRAPRRAR
jgi:hypothetical protein